MLVCRLLQVVRGNVCVVCRETMKSEDEFYAHCQQHHAAAITAAAVAASGTSPGSTVTPSSIPCIVCRQTLVSALELTLHARHHYRANHPQQQQQQQQKQASCCVCWTTDGLLAPLCTTSNSVYYICLACERRDGLAQLGVVASSSKTFQCIKCQQSFSSEDEVRAHVTTHVLQDGNVHRCLLCSGDAVFDSPARLQAHLVAEHELAGVKEATCEVCGLTMSGPAAARQHALEHGVAAWKQACRRCPLRFFFAAELRNHQLVEGHETATSPGHPAASRQSSESVDDPLRCADCSRTFSGYASLCSHRRIHEKSSTASVNVPLDCTSGQRERSGSAPSQCVTAGVDTRSEPVATSLQCPECSRQFPSLSSLQGHMRVHSSGATRCSFATLMILTCYSNRLSVSINAFAKDVIFSPLSGYLLVRPAVHQQQYAKSCPAIFKKPCKINGLWTTAVRRTR